jgi:hypothetical protein
VPADQREEHLALLAVMEQAWLSQRARMAQQQQAAQG